MSLSTTTPDHQKVAWAWLDSLVDNARRNQQPADTVPADFPPGARMSPQARERAVEAAYETVKKKMISSVKAEIGPIQRQEKAIANRKKLDPLYMNWFLVNGSRWPSMSNDTNRALRAIQNIYLWYGAVPSHWNDMRLPDLTELRNRDAAFQELGKWFLSTSIPKLRRIYVREVWNQAHELVKQFKGRNAPRDPIAAKLLMKNFEKRLAADRFPTSPAVKRVVSLFD